MPLQNPRGASDGSSTFHPPAWDVDIDRYINPFLPRAPWHILPPAASRFLGHRTHPQRPIGILVITFWAFLGIFSSISLIEVVNRHTPLFNDHGSPIIIGSFGAAAVLEFYTIEAALAQPRNAILGQLIASLCGVSISKLFALSAKAGSLRWLAGALSCATATSFMALTGTVHPPAGATALMAAVSDEVAQLGWLLIPVILVGSTLMLIVALLVNNIQRRFPLYWWTPEEVGHWWRHRRDSNVASVDIEAKANHPSDDQCKARIVHIEGPQLIISKGLVSVPESIYLRPEEKVFLEGLSLRL